MTFAYIVWHVKPQLLEIGDFQIRWYGILFAAAFICGYYIMQSIFRREGLSDDLLDSLTMYMALGTIVGARIGHCLFYEPGYYMQNPWEILKIWHGGLASHGAAIGILIALYYFSRKHNKPMLWILDRIAIVVALAGFFIRMGNLMNSEIYGVSTNMPWGFIFVTAGETTAKHPTQIYEGLAYFLLFVFLAYLYFCSRTLPHEGFLFAIFLIILFTVRFLIEFIKEEQVEFEKSMILNMGQILSIPFMVAGAYLLWRKKKV